MGRHECVPAATNSHRCLANLPPIIYPLSFMDWKDMFNQEMCRSKQDILGSITTKSPPSYVQNKNLRLNKRFTYTHHRQSYESCNTPILASADTNFPFSFHTNIIIGCEFPIDLLAIMVHSFKFSRIRIELSEKRPHSYLNQSVYVHSQDHHLISGTRRQFTRPL